mmetsp:Transcript_3729/g.13354  ORF Transcript_3729/g.13354 Transcript_3729/m.13354 type:complete len:270 (+) Transcript_3729:726-1535(+)
MAQPPKRPARRQVARRTVPSGSATRGRFSTPRPPARYDEPAAHRDGGRPDRNGACATRTCCAHDVTLCSANVTLLRQRVVRPLTALLHGEVAAPPRLQRVQGHVELLHQFVHGAGALGDGGEVRHQQRVVVVRQKVLLKLVAVHGREAAGEGGDVAQERVVVGQLPGAHELHVLVQHAHAAGQHAHRPVGARQMRRVLRRELRPAVGRARAGSAAAADDARRVVHSDALRLRGLDGVRRLAKGLCGLAVDKAGLGLVQRHGQLPGVEGV